MATRKSRARLSFRGAPRRRSPSRAKHRSMRLRLRRRRASRSNGRFCVRVGLFGTTGRPPPASVNGPTTQRPQAASARQIFGVKPYSRAGAIGAPSRWQEPRIRRRGRLWPSTAACSLAVRPSRGPPAACAKPPLFHRLRKGRAFARGKHDLGGRVLEHPIRHALASPAEAVAERLVRTARGRRVPPTTTRSEHMDDAADGLAVIRPRHAPRIRGRRRFQPRDLVPGKPKACARHREPPSNGLKQTCGALENPVYGA